MTRKILSGVLAFAMVFGATTPVVLADSTTEVVEQNTVYAPSLATDTVTMSKKDDTVSIAVYDVASNATVVATNENFEVSFKDGKVTVKAKKDLTADETITMTFASTQGDKKDTYANSVYLTVKYGKVENYALSTDIEEDTFEDVLAVGKSLSGAYYGTYGDKKGAPTVTAVLNDTAKKFFSVTTSDKKDDDGNVVGTTVTVTATKAMSVDDVSNIVNRLMSYPMVRLTATYGDKKLSNDYNLGFTKADSSTAATSISLTASKTGAVTGEYVNLAAKVGKPDSFGETVIDDYAAVKWYVNGTEIKFGTGNIYTEKNAFGETVYTFTKDLDGRTAAQFFADKAGSYRISVTDESGDLTAAKTITVTESTADVKPSTYSTPYVYAADDKDKTFKWYYEKAAKVGETVDVSGYNYAIRGTDANVYDVTKFGGTVTLSVSGVEIYEDEETKYSADVAKQIATVSGTTVKLADESNATMAKLLSIADGRDLYVKLSAEVKFSDSDKRTISNSLTIKITKSSDKIAKIEYSIAGKAIDSMPVMTVGKTVDVDIKLSDANGYTDAINQSAIWTIQNNDASDKTVYATVDANGVVTAKEICLGQAKLVVVPVADTSKKVEFELYIQADGTVTPTVAPTETPTAAPVETKTGKVTASSLNVRSGAGTDYDKVGKLAKGTAVKVLDEKDGWYKIEAGSVTGWVSAEYVKLDSTTPVVTSHAITTANLKLRTSAVSGSVITTMPKGSTVTVVEKGASWSKVEYNGKTGYASNDYLTFLVG